METYIDKIEKCNFECVAGNISNSKDWSDLKEKVDLWVVTKHGQNICHTGGEGGWRFTVCTNREEAQFLASQYNRTQFGEHKICSVRHLLDVSAEE